MTKKISAVFLTFILILTVFCACSTDQKESTQKSETTSDSQTGTDSKKLDVVCTIFPQYDFCREIAGDKINLTLLLDSKTDLHSFEPTSEDIMKISNCDLFINIGGESDDWAEDVIRSSQNDSLTVLSLMNTVETHEEEALEGQQEEEGEEEEEHEHEQDEHIWTSLKNAERMANAISDKLCALDSDNAETYKANCSAYTKKLAALEKQYADTVSNAKTKTLLFADRFPFRYLAEDYDLDCYAAFSGCSAQSEASFETMAFLVGKVKEENLRYILMIDGSDGSVAESVSRQSGATIRTLNSCQSVPPEDIENGVSYLSIMQQNLTVLKEVLG
ncbi:MAG: metal ABC transporter substrate-binding protein [Oscillospiraceae bacterium]|nr:metal ABC transporter substrate-binding protein [Oscillospiraceae bacterium]